MSIRRHEVEHYKTRDLVKIFHGVNAKLRQNKGALRSQSFHGGLLILLPRDKQDMSMIIDKHIEALHLQRVQNFFASLPPLQADTVDIILQTYLDVPAALLPKAHGLVAGQHEVQLAA